METEKKLYSDILKITLEIQEKYPELIKYLNEMQDTLPESGKTSLDIAALKEYRDSLKNIVLKYGDPK
jgi:hypothetical protein